MSDTSTTPHETRVCRKCGKEYPLTHDYWPKSYGQFRAQCKACHRQYAMEWRAAHREEHNQKNREWRAAHREHVKQYNTEWYAVHREYAKKYANEYMAAHREERRQYSRGWYTANRENLKKRAREYHAAHREERNLMSRRYRIAHLERIREREKEYYAANPEVGKVKAQRRRARKRGLSHNFTVVDWQRALDYFNGCCAVCGRQLNDLFGTHTAAQDHWIPLTSPDCPGTIPTNIVPLCHGVGGCNNSKHAKPPEQWLVKRYGKRKAAAIIARVAAFFEWVEGQQEEVAA